MPLRLWSFVRQPARRDRTAYIIWYAVALHWCWAAALMIGSGPIEIMALRGLAVLGRWPIALLLAGAGLLAGIAARRPPSMPGLLLLMPQQALLAVGASEAVMALLHVWIPGHVEAVETVLIRLVPLIPLATLHTAAILAPFFRREA